MSEEKKPFWETLPGILTGIAAVITALGGVIALFVHPGNKTPVEASGGEKTASTPHKSTQPQPRDKDESSVEKKPRHQTHRDEFDSINVAGVWQDMILGNQVHVTQHGNQLTTRTVYPATGQTLATGTGVISGRTITGGYQWYDGTRYTASLVISDDGQSMNGSYRNPFTGEAGQIQLTR